MDSATERRKNSATEMLHEAWVAALVLRQSRLLWLDIEPELGRGYGAVGDVIRIWYRDHMLSGCRRLLDGRTDVSSPLRALTVLEEIADKAGLDRAELAKDRVALKETHQHVRDAASKIVAHNDPDTGSIMVVSVGDVDRLVDHVLDVLRRWYDVLEGVDLVDQWHDTPGATAVATALELFNWQTFHEALEAAELDQLGPAHSREAFLALRRRARIEYRFD